jgi:hypothetical protein
VRITAQYDGKNNLEIMWVLRMGRMTQERREGGILYPSIPSCRVGGKGLRGKIPTP